VGCFLRYVSNGDAWEKIDTEQANQLLKQSYPEYLYQSTQFDAMFHAVAVNDIVEHHRPELRLQYVLQHEARDEIEHKLQQLIPILVRFGVDCDFLGLTGSMLINQQRSTSDIDLVVFGREDFQKTRQAVKSAVLSGELSDLDLTLMKDNFQRRAGELSFDEFSWHEYRKYNKASIDGTKFDVGMVCLSSEIQQDEEQYQKQGMRTIITKVVDDLRAFDFPAVYLVDDKLTPEVLSFTHTYVGQAKKGELIEVSGAVECNIATGKCRLIVGSTREADGEYIKVINK
jgi:predicted nucleotidyltransferase